jgi:predicted Fe-Mo cluster-binding NifX family protein
LVKRIGVASEGSRGLEDAVASTYGKCRAFTIIDVEHGSIEEVKIKANVYGGRSASGPLVSEMLRKLSVGLVIAGEFGPGALRVLHEIGIKSVVKPTGTTVIDVISEFLLNA